VATILLALLMLTRYVGIFLYLSVVVWWSWWRIKQQQMGRLGGELALLFVAALPILAWLAHNKVVTGGLFGLDHLDPGNHTFVDGLIGAAQQSSWIILPAVRIGPVWRVFGWVGVIPVLTLFISGGYLLWRHNLKEHNWTVIPWNTPIPVLLGVYYALYTFLQPFFLFFPMTRRFMTVALCLIQPWLLSLMANAPRRWSYLYLSGYIALNLTFMSLISISATSGIPDWITLYPPKFHDLANRPDDVQRYLNNGMPSWLLPHPPRLNDLTTYHPDVGKFLQTVSSDVAIVSNAPDLFTYRIVDPGDLPAG
jgi:hypothetical protein